MSLTNVGVREGWPSGRKREGNGTSDGAATGDYRAKLVLIQMGALVRTAMWRCCLGGDETGGSE